MNSWKGTYGKMCYLWNFLILRTYMPSYSTLYWSIDIKTTLTAMQSVMKSSVKGSKTNQEKSSEILIQSQQQSRTQRYPQHFFNQSIMIAFICGPSSSSSSYKHSLVCVSLITNAPTKMLLSAVRLLGGLSEILSIISLRTNTSWDIENKCPWKNNKNLPWLLKIHDLHCW